MDELYIVVELQRNDDQLSHLVTDYRDYSQAQFQFYYASAYAAVSAIKEHTILLINEKGFLIDRAGFYHFEPEEQQIPDEPDDPDNPEEIEDEPEIQTLIIEYQINDEQAGKIVTVYDTLQEANNAFNTIAASAAISNVKKHAIIMIDAVGAPIKNVVFEH
jgi:hypothetical protein